MLEHLNTYTIVDAHIQPQNGSQGLVVLALFLNSGTGVPIHKTNYTDLSPEMLFMGIS